MNKKALVLGSNGFLGQNLIYWLLDNNFDVHAIDRNENHTNNLIDSKSNLSYQKLDLSVKEQVIDNIRFEKYDVIYILAAMTGTKAGFEEYDKYISANENVLLNVLNAYRHQNAKARIVFPSSRLVYKGKKNTLLEEDSEKEANTVYAVNKLACEMLLKCWNNAFDIPYTVFRICVPYGQLIPGDYSYGTLGFLTNQAKQNGAITLYGDGKQKRTFTHVADICEILGKIPLLDDSLNLTINIGSNDNFELKILAEMVAKKFNATVHYKEWPELDLKIESGDTMFDDCKLQSLLQYKYKWNVKEYIKKLA